MIFGKKAEPAFQVLSISKPEMLLTMLNSTKNKNLLIANNYPSYSDLYRNQFLHSRIVEYKSRGKDFDIFILKPDSAINYYEYHGIDVIRGSKSALERLLKSTDCENIFVHFMNEDMWSCVKDVDLSVNLSIWAHA